MAATPYVMILAGEYSGNIYGAAVARELRRLSPGVRLAGTGSRDMAEAGVEVLYDSTSWGGIGVIEALKVVPRLGKIYYALEARLRADPPDAIVLVDYPGFNMFFVRIAYRLGIPTVYHFPPGKFSRRPAEVEEAARLVTRVAAPFRFTYETYQQAGARVEYVGHPLVDALPAGLTRPLARERLGLPADALVVGLLPGSRTQELRIHAPMLLGCARAIAARHPGARFHVPLPDVRDPSMARSFDQVRAWVAAARARDGLAVDVSTGTAHEAMVAADLLLVSSGTATLEAAFYGTPMVIVYKSGWLAEWLARTFFYARLPEHFGLPNIIAGREIVPECIQGRFTEANIVAAGLRLLEDEAFRREQLAGLAAVRADVGRPGTSARIAELALEVARRRSEGGAAA